MLSWLNNVDSFTLAHARSYEFAFSVISGIEQRIQWLQAMLKDEKLEENVKKDNHKQYIQNKILQHHHNDLPFNFSILPSDSRYYTTFDERLADDFLKIQKEKDIVERILGKFKIYSGQNSNTVRKKQHDVQVIITNELYNLRKEQKPVYVGISILCCETCDMALKSWNKNEKVKILYSGSIGYEYPHVENMSKKWNQNNNDDNDENKFKVTDNFIINNQIQFSLNEHNILSKLSIFKEQNDQEIGVCKSICVNGHSVK